MSAVSQPVDGGSVPRSGSSPARAGATRVLAWASLVPLLLVLRPYGGLMQDARIYIGQGIAGLDPAGLGRDMLFAHDAQTRFSVMRPIVAGLLSLMPPDGVALTLASAGLALWLAAMVALMLRLGRDARETPRNSASPSPGDERDGLGVDAPSRLAPSRLTTGRMAWAAAVAVLALPAGYGAFDAFSYAEPIATPRIFAEAAVLGALAALLDRRRLLTLALLAAAMAFHPLMALPGLALAAWLLVAEDRRWLLPLGLAAVVLLLATSLGLPLVGRLFERIDATWLAVLRGRNVNLFPTLWPGEVAGRTAGRLAAVLIAADLCTGRTRTLLRGAAAVGLGGVVASLLFGDLVPGLLVAQLQPWRSLWLLAVVGNAGFAFAALRLWRAGDGGRLALAALILAWCCEGAPALAGPLAAAAVGLRVAARRGRLDALPRRVAGLALLGAVSVAAFTVLGEGLALAGLLGAGGEGGASWPFVVGSGALALPLTAAAVILALAPPRVSRHRLGLPGAAVGFVAVCLVAGAVWDSRTGERRMMETRDGAASLARALGPGTGEVLWIDEDSETWFLAHRPAFFDALQGAPILFSRDLALEWSDRGGRLAALGLVRPRDLAPWTGAAGPEEIALSPAALAGFCADRGRPAALVAPGAQLASVPAGWTASLWPSPVPVLRLSAGEAGLHWRRITAFTVVRCPDPPPAGRVPFEWERTD